MTAEQYIIAAAVQLAHDDHQYQTCLSVRLKKDCVDLADARDVAIGRLCAALRAACIDVRDPVVWDTWRKGRGFDGR